MPDLPLCSHSDVLGPAPLSTGVRRLAHMKAFTWLLTVAFGVVCFTCWAMSGLVMHSLADLHPDLPLPAVTALFIRPNGWILVCPLPWLIYSLVLTVRREVTPAAALVFAGTLFLAAALLVCLVVIASVIPFIALKV